MCLELSEIGGRAGVSPVSAPCRARLGNARPRVEHMPDLKVRRCALAKEVRVYHNSGSRPRGDGARGGS